MSPVGRRLRGWPGAWYYSSVWRGAARLVSPESAASPVSASRAVELLAYLVLHAGSLVPRQHLPTGYSTMHLYPIDGAAARVPEDATPFAYRNGGWAGVIVGVDPDPANAELITGWATSYWEELHPTSAGGAYVNFMMAEGEDRIRASYRGNYDRLAEIKAVYDPENLFHINQNIPPAR